MLDGYLPPAGHQLVKFATRPGTRRFIDPRCNLRWLLAEWVREAT